MFKVTLARDRIYFEKMRIILFKMSINIYPQFVTNCLLEFKAGGKRQNGVFTSRVGRNSDDGKLRVYTRVASR